MDSEFLAPDFTALKHRSDQDVVAALREGQISALDVLYDRYAQQIYSLAYRILANSEEAEDITQEVFLSLWQKNTYQTARGSLKAFLVTMTRSRSIDKLRHRNTNHRFLQRWQRLSVADQETSPPLDHIAIDEQTGLLQQALAVLSTSEREILEIAYYEGMSQSEIAHRLNLPLGTIKSRSRQGLRKLRQHLQNLQ